MLRQAKWLASAGFLFLLAAGAMAQAFDIESATRAYLSSTSAEAIANTDGYVNTGYVIMLLEAVAAVLVAWLLLARGWSRRWRELAEGS